MLNKIAVSKCIYKKLYININRMSFVFVQAMMKQKETQLILTQINKPTKQKIINKSKSTLKRTTTPIIKENLIQHNKTQKKNAQMIIKNINIV